VTQIYTNYSQVVIKLGGKEEFQRLTVTQLFHSNNSKWHESSIQFTAYALLYDKQVNCSYRLYSCFRLSIFINTGKSKEYDILHTAG